MNAALVSVGARRRCVVASDAVTHDGASRPGVSRPAGPLGVCRLRLPAGAHAAAPSPRRDDVRVAGAVDCRDWTRSRGPVVPALFRDAPDRGARLVSSDPGLRHGAVPEGAAAHRADRADPFHRHWRHRRPADVFHREASVREPIEGVRRGRAAGDHAGTRHPQPSRHGLHLSRAVRHGMAALPVDLPRAAAVGDVGSRDRLAGSRLLQLYRVDDHDAAARRRHAARAVVDVDADGGSVRGGGGGISLSAAGDGALALVPLVVRHRHAGPLSNRRRRRSRHRRGRPRIARHDRARDARRPATVDADRAAVALLAILRSVVSLRERRVHAADQHDAPRGPFSVGLSRARAAWSDPDGDGSANADQHGGIPGIRPRAGRGLPHRSRAIRQRSRARAAAVRRADRRLWGGASTRSPHAVAACRRGRPARAAAAPLPVL